MDDIYSGRKSHTIKATRLLQAKVGSGEIDGETIKKSQAVIEGDRTDFAPMAGAFLDQLECLLRRPDHPDARETLLQDVIVQIMQIKANGTMFSYPLSGSLAGIMLNFLEDVEEWNPDVHQIVEAHVRTQRLIINTQMKSDGGEEGARLSTELREVCHRYFRKHAAKDGGGIFVDKR